MDRTLFKKIKEQTPKFNETIAEGLAVEQMKFVKDFIEKTFRSAESRFPEGLTFKSLEYCSPQEQYSEMTRKRNNSRNFEIARSDLFMVKYTLNYNGEDIKRYLYLPYVRDAGIITLRGATFAISPVLADKALSVGTTTIFIPMSMAKIKFERMVQHYYANNRRTTEYVVWSSLYNRSAKSIQTEGKKAVNGETVLTHYLLCKYGLTETFKRYFNADVVVGDHRMGEEEYPADRWVICRSARVKPKNLKDRNYTGSDVQIAVPIDQWSSDVSSAIAGLFYIADYFPDRILPEYVDEPRLWRVLLGKFIFPSGVSEGKLADDVEVHLDSLDGYLDEQVRNNLREDAIYCEDLYDLFVHIIQTYTERINQNSDVVSSMYGKRLTILRYVLYDITSAIYKFMFKLNNMTGQALTAKKIGDDLNYTIRPDLIMRLNHRHGEVVGITVPGDNKVFKVTSNLILQTDSSGAPGNAKTSMSDPAKLLHSSIAEVGSYLHLPKSEPTGRGRINPFVKVAADGLIERREEFRAMLDSVQEKIKR